MKKRTEGTTELILEAAKREFLLYGYNDASLRRIALACDVSTHTIYTRFESKEGLFDAVVAAAAKELEQIHLNALNSVETENSLPEIEPRAIKGTNDVLNYIFEHYDECKLLFCKSAGTKYEHYLDELAMVEEQFYKRMLGIISGKSQEMSDFFIHAICSGGFKPIYEVVAHDLSLSEAREFLEMQERFNFGGWDAVLNSHRK